MAAADSLRLLLLSALTAMATAAAGPRVNILTYFDLAVDQQPVGRIVMGLFKSTPQTSENFRRLCTGEMGFGYKGTTFNRVWQYAGLLGGWIDGKPDRSAYNDTMFKAEGTRIKHSAPYLVTMDTLPMKDPQNIQDKQKRFVGSTFMLTVAPAHHLDLDNTVFGTVIEGTHVLDQLKMYGLPARPGDKNDIGGQPSREIVITDAGQLPLARPFSSKLGFEVQWQAYVRHTKNVAKIEEKGDEVVREAKKKNMMFGLGGPSPASQQGTAAKEKTPKVTNEDLEDPALRAALEHENEDPDEEDDERYRGRTPPPPPPKKVVQQPEKSPSASQTLEPEDENDDEDDRRDRARTARGRMPGRSPSQEKTEL